MTAANEHVHPTMAAILNNIMGGNPLVSEKTPGLPYALYRDRPGLSYSVIKHGRTSMLHMRHAATEPAIETKAMRWGRLVHLAILEPLRAWGSLSVWRGGDRRGKEWAEFKAAAPLDSEIVNEAELTALQAISDAVWANPDAKAMIAATDHEVSLFWQHPEYVCGKARLDGMGDGAWFDLKTTSRIQPEAFARQYLAMGYDLQAGWYTEGLRALARSPAPHTIAVQSKPPYDVAVYQLPAEMVERGRVEAVKLAGQYRECERRGVWPGVSPRVQMLPLPAWYGEGGDGVRDMSDGNMEAEDL